MTICLRVPSNMSPPEASSPLDELAPTPARRRIARRLLRWYRDNRRDLPWRKASDPYAVWVSEVMLQQTQVSTVEPYFRRWMDRFPTVGALATANEDEVLHAWQGLGYYSRARSLLRGAQMVVQEHGGKLPVAAHQLRSLPGIGPYTAGAIASIAFDQDEPIVDGNVIRVLTRLFALPGDPQRATLKKQLWQLATLLIPRGQAADFNQSLMELGALVCTPNKPLCSECPVREDCRAVRQDRVSSYPQLRKRPKPTQVLVAAALTRRAGRVLVVQLPADAKRWASMWQFPNAEVEPATKWPRAKTDSSPWEPNQQLAGAAEQALFDAVGLHGEAGTKLAELRHSVTRFRIHLSLFEVRPEVGKAVARQCQAVRWCRAAELADLAMPAAHRRLAHCLEPTVLAASPRRA